MKKRILLPGLMLSTAFRFGAASQPRREPAHQGPLATVNVSAFDSYGKFLGVPSVTLFIESGGRHNLAGKFHGGAATGIPYGRYKIEGSLPWHFSDSTYVMVYQPTVTAVLGLRFDYELPQTPPTLRGNVVGLPPSAPRSFVRLIGVYEHVSIESAIHTDGSFEIGGLSHGKFLLLVVGESGVVASQILTIPYTGPPLEVHVTADGAPRPTK